MALFRRDFRLVIAAALLLAACGCGESDRQFVSIGTAPVGGTFPVVGGAVAEVLNEHRGEHPWKAQIKGSKGSQENIRRAATGQFQLGMSNSAISYFAFRGESGWEKKYDVRAVCTMAPLVAMFITKQDSGIREIEDLKGKRVVVGPAGAGFEMFVRPIVEAHGLGWDEITPVYAAQGIAVDQLSDGAADAAFLGGALPSPAIIQASGSFDVYFVPFDPQVRAKLIKEYPFFKPVPYALVAGRYNGTAGGEMKPKDEWLMHYDLIDEFEAMNRAQLLAFIAERKLAVRGADKAEVAKLRSDVVNAQFGWLNVGSMQLITHKDADKEFIKAITRTIWENRDELAKKHPALKFLEPKTIPSGAVRIQGAMLYTGIPFHPGAEEFYTEIGMPPNEKNLTKLPPEVAAAP